MLLRRYRFAFFLISAVFCGLTAQQVRGQVVPAAVKGSLSLTAGGFVSVFQPDYVDYKLGGVGGYVDLNVFRGYGIEAEGRWQHFHEYYGISQDNYLIGPRKKIFHFWKAQPYVKVLGGFSNMNFGPGIGTGRFNTIAFGGGTDIRLDRRWSVRGDFEYQWWPDFLGDRLNPYGVSVGMNYRIF